MRTINPIQVENLREKGKCPTLESGKATSGRQLPDMNLTKKCLLSIAHPTNHDWIRRNRRPLNSLKSQQKLESASARETFNKMIFTQMSMGLNVSILIIQKSNNTEKIYPSWKASEESCHFNKLTWSMITDQGQTSWLFIPSSSYRHGGEYRRK